MFNIQPVEPVKMGLMRRAMDYTLTSADPTKAQRQWDELTTEQKFRTKTSGTIEGGHEKVMKYLRAISGTNNFEGRDGFIINDSKRPTATSEGTNIYTNYGPSGLYQLLLDKLDSNSGNFDSERMRDQDMYMFIRSNIDWVTMEIKSKISSGESEDHHLRYKTEADQEGSDDKMITTDAFIMHADTSAYEEYDIDPDKEYQAKLDIINSLALLRDFQMTVLTGETTQNAIMLLQAYWAHDPFVNFQLSMRQAEDPSIPKATSQTKMWSSLNLSTNDFIKATIDKRLDEMLVEGQEYALDAYRLFVSACTILNIDIVLLDAEKLMSEGYISKLRQTLLYKRTAIVNEYDLEELTTNPEDFDAVKMSHVGHLLSRALAPITGKMKGKKEKTKYEREVKSITLSKSIRDQIDEINLFNFRNLNTIVGKVQQIKTSKEKQLVNPLTGTKVSKNNYERIKLSKTSILKSIQVEKKSGQVMTLEGPMAEQPARIIREVINNYLEELTVSDHKRYSALKAQMLDLRYELENPADGVEPIEVQGSYFVYSKSRLYYELQAEIFYQETGDEKFTFDKWLLHKDGFLVSKYLDAETLKNDMNVFRAPDNDNDNISKLIIKTLPIHRNCQYCGQVDAAPDCPKHSPPMIFDSEEIFRGTRVADYS